MAEEQIEKLTIEIESVGGDDKKIADIRKQLEKLGRVDLSGTIKQLGNLRQALGYLGTVDDSVKSMLDNMAKLGLRANSVSAVKKQLDDVSKSARQSKEEIAEVIDRAMKLHSGGRTASTGSEELRTAPITNPKAYGYDQSAIEAIDRYAESLDQVDKKQRKNKKSAQEMGDAAKQAGDKATSAMQKTNNAAKKTQKTTSALSKTFTSMLRFRIVGTIMHEVTQSASEGIKALGEFDAEFKETLNTYSAASKAAGGSFALTLAPALEAAAPLIEYIADGIGSIGNSISMITAMIKGDDFYQAVKPVSQIKKEMAAAEEKAKNVKQLISGFDELNIFQKPDTGETGVKIFEDRELSWGNDELREDLANLAEFITVAGVAALAVGFLKNAFSGKNKTLKEQTDLTKEDVKETKTMKDVVSALIPQVNGVTSALGILGGMGLPALDSSGITVPAGEAVGALDALGAKQPAPTVATEPLLAGVNLLEGKVNEFVTAEYAPVVLSGSDTELVKAMEAAGIKVNEFATGFTSEFNTQFGEIKKGWANTSGDMQDIAKKSASAVGITYKTAFGEIELDWANTMGAMLELSLTAFDNVELMWNSTISDMQAAWSKAFAGGLSVNVPETNETPATSATVENNPYTVDTYGEAIAETAKVVGGTIAAGKAAGGAIVGAGLLGGAALGAVGGSGGVMLPNLMFKNLYANGGLVTAGEFFMARENGKPEFVGSFGNQTGVANNEQIVSGISGGVEAVLAAYIPQIIRAIEENATAVNIGDDQIARAAQRGAASYQRRTGRSMFN